MNVTLIDPPETDAEGNTRSFSIASAPFEEDLVFATRMRDTAFKRILKSLRLGSEVRISGAFGSFTLHTDASRPAVFLVGGIGITPFRSIILDATRSKLAHKMYLLYSNRRPEDAAFLDELQRIEQDNPVRPDALPPERPLCPLHASVDAPLLSFPPNHQREPKYKNKGGTVQESWPARGWNVER